MLTKILVANRGEIAVRVIRACRELGIATVAVYSELDRDALHVRLADEAYALGGQTAAESYLNTEAILDVIRAQRRRRRAPRLRLLLREHRLRPGRSPSWAWRSSARRPRPSRSWATRSRSRIAAERGRRRRRARHDRVPITSRRRGAAPSATTHGWPVAIKAAFGGGGRGMKVVRDADERRARHRVGRSARRKAYFGRDEIYMERYLTWPRHVEMQIIGDTHGNLRVGRRARLLGAAPPPEADRGEPGAGVPRRRRARRWARPRSRWPRPCGYVNAGTVEFLYQDGEFFFLEMNTRLQVEHPVTEMVTGIDLVAEQIRVAVGRAAVVHARSDVERRGHAIEIRINAENPAGGRFLPSPGTITQAACRPTGFGVRWDGGYEAGDEISQYYDNLVGKLVVWGARPRHGHRPACCGRSRRSRSRASPPPSRPTSPSCATPTSRRPTHSTKWVEETLDLSGDRRRRRRTPAAVADGDGEPPRSERDVDVEVNGKRFAVAALGARVGAGGRGRGRAAAPRRPPVRAGAAAGGGRRRQPAAARSPCRCRARS